MSTLAPQPGPLSHLRTALRRTKVRFGLANRVLTEDRRVLEKIILPEYQKRTDLQRVLFVGCGWYTEGYGNYFRGREYWTLDIDPAAATFGSPKRHITDSLANLSQHFQPGYLDLIVCNGVFGWGLNDPVEVEAAVEGCWQALRPEGVFLFGWNDIRESRPFGLEEIASLRKFEPEVFDPLGTTCYLTATDNRHTFNFYKRPGRALSQDQSAR